MVWFKLRMRKMLFWSFRIDFFEGALFSKRIFFEGAVRQCKKFY